MQDYFHVTPFNNESELAAEIEMVELCVERLFTESKSSDAPALSC
jgi:hypothetical protein